MEKQGRFESEQTPADSSPQLQKAWLPVRGIGLSVALALASALAAPALSQAQDLTIRWVDSYGLFDVGSDALGSQVQSAFEQLAVRVQWRDDPTLASTPVEREFVIHLRPSEPGELGFPPHTMGVVFGVRHHATNIWVFFPTIVRAVVRKKQPPLVGGSTRRGPWFETPELQRLKKLAWLERERVVRAMSAVVVHEVIHAIAPSTGAHASEGGMSRKLSELLLLDGAHPLDERSATALRRELARLVVVSAEGRRASRTRDEENDSPEPGLEGSRVEAAAQQ